MELVCEIGNGKQGKVFLARLIDSHETIVLKEFNDSTAATREQESLERLIGAKHINQIFPINCEGQLRTSKPTLAISHCPNGELYNFIEVGLSVELSKAIIHQCLRGLLEMHSVGVVHRDIKPENIFIDSNYEIKIGDLGLSSIVEVDNPFVDELRGTPSYIAPEVHNWARTSIPFDGMKADIWSLGCVLFVMVTGNRPFGDDGAVVNDWFFRQFKRQGARKFWAQHEMHSARAIPPSMKSLLESMLQVDPARRPSIPELLEHECLQGMTLTLEAYQAHMEALREEILRKECKQRAGISHAFALDADCPPTKKRSSS